MDDFDALQSVKVKLLHEDAQVPVRAHRGDAGADLFSIESVTLEPGERAVIGTGIAIALPVGTVGLVHPRSGLAVRHGLTMVNAPGTIDCDYRGELKVILLNTDKHRAVTIERGDRIAQLVVQRVELPTFEAAPDLDETVRGTDGFGSSGGHKSLA